MNKEDKDKITLHLRGLLSRNGKVYSTSFNWLVNNVGDSEDRYEDGDRINLMDQWNELQRIFLVYNTILLKSDEMEELATVKAIYNKLEAQVGELVETQDELNSFRQTNEWFNLQMHIILKQY